MSEELKPCPFCGKSIPILDEPIQEDEYAVFCNKCGAIGPQDDDGNNAVSYWNNRPIEDALQSEISRLTERVRELEDANRWHKTDDDNLNLMPKKDEDVLFVTKQNNIIRGHWEWRDEREEYYKYPAWTDYFDEYDCDKVTHWMPLPTLPEVEG